MKGEHVTATKPQSWWPDPWETELVESRKESPLHLYRHLLQENGWREYNKVTVLRKDHYDWLTAQVNKMRAMLEAAEEMRAMLTDKEDLCEFCVETRAAIATYDRMKME